MKESGRRRRRRRARDAFGHGTGRAINTVGGLACLGGGVFIGWEAADFLHRWVSTLDPAMAAADAAKILPKGVDIATYNLNVVYAKPGWKSLAAQGGVALVGFVAGAFIPWTWAKLIMYGIGIGAASHAFVQAADGWIIKPMLMKSDTGKRLYAPEIQSDSVINPASTTSGPPTMGAAPAAHSMRGTPVAAAAPLPMGQPARVPTAHATMGQAAPAPTVMITGPQKQVFQPTGVPTAAPGGGISSLNMPSAPPGTQPPAASVPSNGSSLSSMPPSGSAPSSPSGSPVPTPPTNACASSCDCSSCSSARMLGAPPPPHAVHPMLAGLLAPRAPNARIAA